MAPLPSAATSSGQTASAAALSQRAGKVMLFIIFPRFSGLA